MTIDLKGKRAIIAGGSRGIGRAIVLAFAEAGAAVSFCARGPAALEATRADAAKFGGLVHAAACDLSQQSEIERYIAEAQAALGGLDVLINNASGFGRGDDEASWDASLNVDVMAVVRASRAAMPALLASGDASIINIASGSGLNPSVRTPAYGAAKAATIHYTRTQAASVAHQNIRVNCICPGSMFFEGGTSPSATTRRSTPPPSHPAPPAAWARRRKWPMSPSSSPRHWPAGSPPRSSASMAARGCGANLGTTPGRGAGEAAKPSPSASPRPGHAQTAARPPRRGSSHAPAPRQTRSRSGAHPTAGGT